MSHTERHSPDKVCDGCEPPLGDAIYCSAQTYRASRDNPAEYCETEVDQEGDLCARHDEDDRSDADYDNYLESLRKE